jgi:hypothetical protein
VGSAGGAPIVGAGDEIKFEVRHWPSESYEPNSFCGFDFYARGACSCTRAHAAGPSPAAPRPVSSHPGSGGCCGALDVAGVAHVISARFPYGH